jgi:hypothetical protein
MLCTAQEGRVFRVLKGRAFRVLGEAGQPEKPPTMLCTGQGVFLWKGEVLGFLGCSAA